MRSSDFGRLVRAEWTKFRTVRGWVLGIVAAAAGDRAAGAVRRVEQPSRPARNGTVEVECPTPRSARTASRCEDKFYFVHQPLAGDGAITVRVTSMTGLITYPPPNHDEIVPGLVRVGEGRRHRQGRHRPGIPLRRPSWSPPSTACGCSTTSSTTRRASPARVSAGAPRWLRLTRTGDTLTGEESADGAAWTRVGTATLAGHRRDRALRHLTQRPHRGQPASAAATVQARLATATATFDNVGLTGTAPGGDWLRDDVGRRRRPGRRPAPPGRRRGGGRRPDRVRQRRHGTTRRRVRARRPARPDRPGHRPDRGDRGGRALSSRPNSGGA